MCTSFFFDIIQKEITVLFLGTYLHNPTESEGPMKQKIVSFICFMLALTLTVPSILPVCFSENEYAKFTRRALDVFDTEITLIGYARS